MFLSEIDMEESIRSKLICRENAHFYPEEFRKTILSLFDEYFFETAGDIGAFCKLCDIQNKQLCFSLAELFAKNCDTDISEDDAAIEIYNDIVFESPVEDGFAIIDIVSKILDSEGAFFSTEIDDDHIFCFNVCQNTLLSNFTADVYDAWKNLWLHDITEKAGAAFNCSIKRKRDEGIRQILLEKRCAG